MVSEQYVSVVFLKKKYHLLCHQLPVQRPLIQPDMQQKGRVNQLHVFNGELMSVHVQTECVSSLQKQSNRNGWNQYVSLNTIHNISQTTVTCSGCRQHPRALQPCTNNLLCCMSGLANKTTVQVCRQHALLALSTSEILLQSTKTSVLSIFY